MRIEHWGPINEAIVRDKEASGPLPLNTETLLISDRQIVIPTESIINFDKADPLEPDIMELLRDPRVGSKLVIPGAKCNWRVPHMVLTADMIAEADREGELEKAGFIFTKEELKDYELGLLLHDLGFAFTNLPSVVLNPLKEGDLRTDTEKWEEAKTHPDRTAMVLGENGEFSPYTVYVAMNHHNFGGRKDAYGGGLVVFDQDSVHLPTQRETLIAPWVDVPHAAGDVRRLYKKPSGLSEIEAIMRKLFIGEPEEIPEELQIPDRLLKFFANAAHKRGNFRLPATDGMDAFAQKVIGTKDLWENPNTLPHEFAKFAHLSK